MELDVPLHPDPDYLDLLARNAERVRTLHFGLDRGEAADARVRLTERDLEEWIKALGFLSRQETGQAAYLLLNARFHGPERLRPEALSRLCGLLEALSQEPCFAGIVYADAYFLRALSRVLPPSLSSSLSGNKRLEAVPSVNCRIDSLAAARSHLDLVGRTGFAPPSRLVLDRGLNRDMARLAEVAGAIRALRPGIRLELLANEGCLRACPFRPAHEAVVAACHSGPGQDTFSLNRDLGCLDFFLAEPWRIFASPFIRPEDMGRYEGLVDGFKVCGRNRGGSAFLTRAVRAWLEGRYQGNLLAILDTLGEFEDRFLVPNQDLPQNFHALTTDCAGDCSACPTCRSLVARHLTRREPGPRSLEGEVRP